MFSFDCDTKEDIVASELLFRRFQRHGLKMTLSVPGEQLEDVGPRLANPLQRGALRIDVTAEYFRDHAEVHRSSHQVDPGGVLRVPMTLTRAGKHHVEVSIFDGVDGLGAVRFDLTVRPGS